MRRPKNSTRAPVRLAYELIRRQCRLEGIEVELELSDVCLGDRSADVRAVLLRQAGRPGPIVVMTGYQTRSPQDATDDDAGAANRVIRKKPVDPSEIAATLDRLLER